MSVYQLFTVLRIELFLDFGASVCQVEHELTRPADDLVGAFSYDWDLLDGRDQLEFVAFLVFLRQCVNLPILVLEVANLEH